MADVHSSHQSGNEHLTFNHQHNHDAQDAENKSKNLNQQQTQNSDFDCHHCCHCHGVHHHWIVTNLVLPQANHYKQTYLIQPYSLPPSPHENLLRPPIKILVI